MKRIHWWSGGVGAAVITVAVFVAPTALAAHDTSVHLASKPTPTVVPKPQPSPPLPKPRPSSPPKPVHGHGHGHGHGPHCPYPPSGNPHVVLNTPSGGRSGSWHFTGWVKVNHCGYGGVPAGLYSSDDGNHSWHQVAAATTADDGGLKFDTPNSRERYFRVVVAGFGGLGATSSDVLSNRSHARQR